MRKYLENCPTELKERNKKDFLVNQAKNNGQNDTIKTYI